MQRFTTLEAISLALLIIGGLVWGLIGLINFDVISTLFGSMPGVVRIIYLLIGLAAIYVLVKWIMTGSMPEKKE